MTSRKNKGTRKPKAKELTNPASSGGAGPAFENRIQATRLLAMCLGSLIPGIPDGRIVELKFQARIHGHHTDDLVCHIELTDGQRVRALLQMKRTLKARKSDAAFSESVGAAWTDYHSDEFVRGQDSIFFIYDTTSAAAMKGAVTVCEWARYSATPEEFFKKVATENFSNSDNRSALAAIKAIAETYADGALDEDELFDFIKHLNCQHHDLDRDGTVEQTVHLNSIKEAAALVGEVVNPQEIWSALVAACMTCNAVAGSVTFGNLESIIGKRLNGLFAGARNFRTSPYAVVPLAEQPSGKTLTSDTMMAVELARLSGLVESFTKSSLQPAIRDQLPAASHDSANKLISEQLDRIHSHINQFRYQDAFEDLSRLANSREQFDAHQEARWHLLQGTCKWHLEDGTVAAADFILAAQLCEDDDKFAAAGIRGLLLQGDAAGAAAAGAEALKTFPESLAVWQATSNARMNLGEKLTLEDVPSALRGEADALQMLAWSQHQQGDKVGAARTALQALEATTPNFFTRNTALILCLDQAASVGVSTAFQLFSTKERSDLERCISEFSPRRERLWQIQSPQTVATTAANLGTAYLLLGQPEVTLAVLEEARTHGVSSPAFLRVEIEALAAVGDLDNAIATGKSQIDVMSVDALAVFAQLASDADDLDAVGKALDAAKKFEREEPQLIQDITAMRWTVLAKVDIEAALQIVRAVDWVTTHSVSGLVAGARILRNAGFTNEAADRIQRAFGLITQSTNPGEKYLVARYLLLTRDYKQAATLFEQIAPLGKHSQFQVDLLFCYLRSGRRAKAKELIDAFPSGWESHARTRHMAMELGQLAGDWDLLAKLIPVEFDQAPGKIRSWLLRAAVAARTPADDVRSALQDAPVELSGSAQEIAQLAALELQHGYKERAMRRLYVMRRKRLDSTEIAALHVVALLAVTDELPLMEGELPSVAPGTSVTLMDDEGRSQVFTLDPDDLPKLPATTEFLTPESKEASTIVGLVIGDELSVPDVQGKSRVLTVRRICSAYRRLLELSQQALNAPLAPSPIARMMTIHNEEAGKPDFSGLTRELQQVSARAKHSVDVYASSPITLGGLAKLLGRDVLDIVRGWTSDGPAMQVSGGNPDERARVIDGLKTSKGPYLIDAATLVELGTLAGLDALTALPNLLVTSHTQDILEAKLVEAQTEQTKGMVFEQDGELGFVERTAEKRQQEIDFFQSVINTLRQCCRVVPAYGTDSLPTLAYELERAISAEEFSVILAAAEYGATLVSLDARLRFWAGQLSISGIWPQVLLMFARDIGKLPALPYSLATVRQLCANRTFVSVAPEDLAFMAYQGTEWLKFGISRFTRYIALPETEFNSALRVSVGFLQRLASDGPCHFGAFCRLLQVLAEGLTRHRDAPRNLERRLLDAVLKAIQVDEENAVRRQILSITIQNGHKDAQRANAVELKNVRVLMCSDPPWIAYVSERPNAKTDQVVLQVATDSVSIHHDRESPTSASDTADNPFR